VCVIKIEFDVCFLAVSAHNVMNIMEARKKLLAKETKQNLIKAIFEVIYWKKEIK
jgi:hypothetical protein